MLGIIPGINIFESFCRLYAAFQYFRASFKTIFRTKFLPVEGFGLCMEFLYNLNNTVM